MERARRNSERWQAEVSKGIIKGTAQYEARLTALENTLTDLALPQPEEPVFRAQDFMTKERYRKLRARAGFPMEKDQDVCHLIAESLGGANHIDNFIDASAALNRSVGNRNDSLLIEVAGLEKAKKAVAVSRLTGYKGPGAEELIAIAKAARTAAPRPAARRPARNVRVPTKHVKVRLAKKEYSLCI